MRRESLSRGSYLKKKLHLQKFKHLSQMIFNLKKACQETQSSLFAKRSKSFFGRHVSLQYYDRHQC